MTSINNKVIAITGGASGMGRATATLLASLGARVSLADANASLLKEVEAELVAAYGVENIYAKLVDVRDRVTVEAWIKETVDKFGKLDGAANLAGVSGRQQNVASVAEVDDDDWDFVMDVNVKGVLNSIRAQIPMLNDGASVVVAASTVGLMALPNNAAYVTSKHAVVGLTRTAARELGSRSIRVNAIAPGPIETPMLKGAATRMGGDPEDIPKAMSLAIMRLGKATEVAALVAFLLGDDSKFTTGCVYPVDGGQLC
ncbi:hypothetical protein FSHL1_006786 [Fusarium sambucinum]